MPNVILITTDQQRYDTLGCNGNSFIHTPNLDELAAQGADVYKRQSLDYRTLTYKRGENFCLPFFVSNSGEAFSGKVRILVRSLSGKVLSEDSRSAEIPENLSIQAGMTEGTVPEEELFFVTLYLEEEGRTLSENTYMFGTSEKEVFAPLFKKTGRAELKITLPPVDVYKRQLPWSTRG